MKNLNTFEQFEQILNESAQYPAGTQYKISAQLDNPDDMEAFAEGHGLSKTSSNWIDSYVNAKKLKAMIKDLKEVYGLEDKQVVIQRKGGGPFEFYNLSKLPKGI